ncbi:MAG: undecaprenyl-diphosphate phosphatase [Phycisphaerales bacterium]|nr:undecaprenyl-diphosphate phosphatase [Phycisphaerales bacterium]
MPDVLTILDAILLGLVEGITEYLPVSSTGHLVLLASLLGLDQPPQVKEATDDLLIVIQGGAILAVLGLYRRPVARMCLGIAGKDRQGLQLARNIVIAFLPAAILGPLLDETIESHLMAPWPVLGALIAGGILMIAMGSGPKRATQEGPSGIDLTIRAALIIGLLQCLAMWPGTSRSMVTIVGGMWMGLSAARAAEFSFLLGLPTLGGACVYKLTGNLTGDEPNMFQVLGTVPIIVGTLVATIAAAIAIKWLVSFLTRHGLAAFGWYRIVLAVVLGALVMTGAVSIGAQTPSPDAPQSTVATD